MKANTLNSSGRILPILHPDLWRSVVAFVIAVAILFTATYPDSGSTFAVMEDADMSQMKIHFTTNGSDEKKISLFDDANIMLVAAMALYGNREKDLGILNEEEASALNLRAEKDNESKKAKRTRQERQAIDKQRREWYADLETGIVRLQQACETLSSLDCPAYTAEYQQAEAAVEGCRKALKCTMNKIVGGIGNGLGNMILNKANLIIDEMMTVENRQRFFADPNADFTRTRKMTLHDLIMFLLTEGRGSLGKELFNYYAPLNDTLTAGGLDNCREKLSAEGVKYFAERISEEMDKLVVIKVAGLDIYATDGSDTDTFKDENGENHMQPNGDKAGYNQYHVVTFFNALCRNIRKVVVQNKGEMNESLAVAQMIRSMSFASPSCVLGDRGIPSFNLMATIHQTKNLDYLFRVPEGWMKELKSMPLEQFDTDIEITICTKQTNVNKERRERGEIHILSGKSPKGKNKKSMNWEYEEEYKLPIRVVRFPIKVDPKTGEITWETILTSLPRDKYPLETIKLLYRIRWQIELSYRTLKYACNMSFYHCKKEEYSKQEIYARVALYNIAQVLIQWAEYGIEAADMEAEFKETKTAAVEKEEALADNTASSKEDEVTIRWIPAEDEKAAVPVEKPSEAAPPVATSESAKPKQKSTNAAKSGQTQEKDNPAKLLGYQINQTFAIYVTSHFLLNNGVVGYDLLRLIGKHMVPVYETRSFKLNLKGKSFIPFFYR